MAPPAVPNPAVAAPASPAASVPKAAAKGFPYRLRNTDEPIETLLRRETALLLRNAVLDTRLPGRPAIPARLALTEDPEAYIVQARGAIDAAFRQRLTDAGATVVSYLPNNAYLARLSAAQAKQVAADPRTQAVLPLEPYYKLEPSLLALAVEDKPLPEGRLNLLLFPGERDRAAQALTQLGAGILFEENTPFGPLLTVRAPADSLAALARLASVQGIEPYRERRLANDLTRVITGVSTDTTTAAPTGNHLGLTGAGVTVAMSDSGVDATHPDLAGRVTGLTADNSGHGTHVAGIIAGNGSASRSSAITALGSVSGADFRGMAPAARLHSMFYGLVIGDTLVQEQTASSNIFLLNNSWVYAGAFDYDIHAASYDNAVRDALPGQTGAQPLTIVFAAGDSGDGSPDGTGGAAGSIQSPGTGKNVITVGASELPRGITNTVTRRDPAGNLVTNLLWLGMTDSTNQISYFSARGNVARGLEGDAGRFKPDVVAPGAMVVSCKSADFTYPSAFYYTSDNTVPDVTLLPGSTNLNAITIPDNAVSFTIVVITNAFSPVPFPSVSIFASNGAPPTAANFVGYDFVTIAPTTPGTLYYSLGNAGTIASRFDLRTILVMTNDIGNYYSVLSNLNATLGPYRYEWGTSMSAAAVSGLLALMEERFQQIGLTNASPALRKALLIHGARSLSLDYNFLSNPVINLQGWGLANLTNSVPSGQTRSSGPLRFFDQNLTNALTTGASQTRTIDLSAAGRFADLRVTLVWTDPPGNPLASVKLVNDLDLIVTNLDTGEVFLGNHFAEDGYYSQKTTATETNLALLGDRVNNVENVFLKQPLGARYSVTVVARRVHVNALNNHPNGIVQDYALVIGTANPAIGDPFTTVTESAVVTNAAPLVAPLAASAPGSDNTQPLFYHRAGANSPLLGGTNGTVNQWTFFVYTNRNAGSNVIYTFIPPNLSRARTNEADIDLYVTRSSVLGSLAPQLTNLVTAAITLADKSLTRGGTEYIIYTNAQAGEVFYIGVKSEDQQAGEFGVGAFDSGNGGQLDENGNLVLPLGPALIPDGMPDAPGGTNVLAFAMHPMTIQRVIVTNLMTHENGGDLVGILSHDDQYAVLNNHSAFEGTTNWVYDDSGQADVAGGINTDGPGSLLDFVGEQALGMWEFTLSDNALHHTGQLERLTLLIEPTSTNANYPVYLTRILGAGGYLDTAIDVPADATNLEVCVSATGPVEVSLRNTLFATVTAGQYDYFWTVADNLCTNVTRANVPPLSAGRYMIHVFNPGGTEVRVTVRARFTRDVRTAGLLKFESTRPVALLDDAVTNSTLTVTSNGLVTAVEVGVRLEHARASDLVLHLVSPQGVRILLAENRGRTNALGFGSGTGADTIYVGFTENTNLTTTPIKFAVPPFTNMLATQSTVVDFSGFEPSAAREYLQGSTVDGWQVVSNAVSVARDPEFAHSGAQLLALSSGRITRQIPTLAGHQYRLTIAYRDSGAVGWWRGEGNTVDLINGNNGVLQGTVGFGSGMSGQAFDFTGQRDQKVTLADIPDYQTTNSVTIESWVNLRALRAGVEVIFFRGNDEDDSDPYKIMVQTDGRIRFVVCTPNGAVDQYLVSSGMVPLNTWTHVIGTLDGNSGDMRIYLNGVQSAQVNTPIRPYPQLIYGTYPGIAIGNHFSPLQNSPFNGLLDEVTLYRRALTEAEVHAIYRAGPAGKLDALTPAANARFELVGYTNQVLYGGKFWQTNTVIFTATSNLTTLNLSGNVLGMLFDTLNVEEVPKDSWYLPEEPLTPLYGLWAGGTWTLEILDNRTGGALTNANLLSWHLNLGIANPSIIPTTAGANTSPLVAGLSGTAAAYYVVQIPDPNGIAVNRVVSDGAPLKVWLNEAALPTGDSAGDVPLLSGVTNGEAVVQAGVKPLSGNLYYLGVMNADPTATNTTFRLQVDLLPAMPPRLAAKVSPIDPTVTFGQQGFTLTWNAPRWQRFQVQYADGLPGEWKTIPGIVESQTGQFVFGDDGSQTGPLTGTRFYRLILAP